MKFLSLLVGVSLLALGGCSGTEVKETLGLDRRAPDEFRVVSRPPLSVPSEFYLVPPQPGAGAFSNEQADIQARSLLTGKRITTLDNLDSANNGLADTAAPVVSTSSLPSPAESSVLQKAGASAADPAIKEKLYEDYRATKDEDPGILENLRGEGDSDPVVDAKGEAKRIKKNKEAKKPANEGEVPVVDPKDKSVLGARLRLMKFLTLLGLLWLAAFASPAFAKLDAKHYELPNGLKVVVVERPGTEVITHMIWFDIGSTYEPLGKSGIAHYLEHLVFKETEELGVNEYSRRIEAMGGNNNAFTGRDFTAYYVSIGASNLEEVMKLEAERLQRLNPSQESFDSEKGVILEERAMRIDNQPLQQLQESMMSALFRHHQYRIPIIGWEHEIKALSLKDAMDFYHYYYQPKNATMLVVGDVKAEDVYALAKKHFGRWRTQPEAKPLLLEEPPRKAEISLTLHHPGVRQPQWLYMYNAPSLGVGKEKDIFPLMVLSELLGSGKTSLLYKEMAVKNKTVIDTGSDYDSFLRGPGTFTVYATPAEGASREEFYAGYQRILQAVAKDAVPAAELTRVKNKLKAESVYARDGNTAIAYLLGQLLVLGKNERYFNAWEDSIDAVTADDIRAAATLLLKNDPPVAGVLLPEVK